MTYDEVFSKPYPNKAVIKRLILGGILVALMLLIASFLGILILFIRNEHPFYRLLLALVVIVVVIFFVSLIIHSVVVSAYLCFKKCFITQNRDYFKIFLPVFIIDFLLAFVCLYEENGIGYSILEAIIYAMTLCLIAILLSIKVLPKYQNTH